MSIVELSFAAFAVVGFLGILGIVVIVTGRAPKSFNWKKNLDENMIKKMNEYYQNDLKFFQYEN